MKKLPENLIKLDRLRIERGMGKLCKCKTQLYTLDTDNQRVTCQTCGAPIEPFQAMLKMAEVWGKINAELEMTLQQKKELDNYKPHLKIIKDLEKRTRSGPNQSHPICPVCDEPFMLSELTRFYGAKFVTGQIVERIDRQRKERGEK
ncbi:hypothetical protein MHH70_12415 [Metasolibacillus sp. FSL H7-0170]|uniref:hypothetical protein n=1 Tax=Metasolibacillus sp. FSL H7-0170 TaxID=2921431 RepID=UPI00315866A8